MTNPLTVPIGELSVAEQIVGNLYHMVLTNPASLSEMVGHADRIYSDVRGEGERYFNLTKGGEKHEDL